VIDDTLRGEAANVCLRAASVLSLREGKLWIVDINRNPDIGRIAVADFLKALIMAAATHCQ
jgi:hypothetical protein